MAKSYKDSTTLIFKNIPKYIEDITNLLNSLNIPAKSVKPFGRKRALITYESKSEAEKAVETLRDLEFAGKPANVSWFCNDKPKENKVTNTLKTANKCVQVNIEQQADASGPQTLKQINKYVQKLYAMEGDLGFNQPPPPYLKYNYPPINKDIMDNICISLLSNKRFYTQVLHLMNRMNLEPPFGERKHKLVPPEVPKDMGTQTEEMYELAGNQQDIEYEEETELETSGEEDSYKNRLVAATQLKRKLPPNEEQYKKKARQVLQNLHKVNKESTKKSTTSKLSIKDIFDKPETSKSATTKIEVQVKQLLTSEETKKSTLNVKPLTLPDDLTKQKLSQEDLQQLPIYKNYQKGEVSNKLYIKNLNKDVSAEDLTALYGRFLPANCNINLDIKVMQHGRMKGQAFVTFQGKQTDIIHKIIVQAIAETNGFILRDKPMIVCYGKRS